MNKNQKQLNWKILLGVGIISMTLFMYEIILSRLYSTLLLYHYVFMIASIAILGMGIGSILQYKVQSKDTFNESVDNLLSKKGFQLGGIMVFSFLLIYFLPYLTAPIYILINMVPYIFAGQLFAILFTAYGEKSNAVYFADLIGAGTGAAGSIGLFYGVGFISGIGITFALMFLGIWVWSINSKHYRICITSALLGGIFLVASLLPSVTNFIESQFTGYMTSPNSSLARLRKADENHEIIYTKWDGYARTDVIRMPQSESRRIVTINGGANASMMQWSGNLNDDGGIKKGIDYSPYIIGNSEDVAIVGAGGGKDVLLALLGGAKNIDAIEINASAVDAVKKMGDYNGKIYEHPGVNVIVGDGRSSIAKSNKQYDVIFLSLVMTSTSESMGYAMAENYIYTEEAVKEYLNHLKPDGRLIFVAHAEGDMLKLGNTVYTVLGKSGIPPEKIPNHMIMGANVKTANGHQMVHTPIIMIKKQPYSQQEIQKINQFFKENKYFALHIATTHEENYFVALSKNQMTMNQVFDQFKINIVPATDERPFFYNYTKKIPNVFMGVTLIVLLFIGLFFVPTIVRKKVVSNSIHFSLLGIAFMMIEIAMIQKMTLFLEHPTIAFVVTSAALLIGASIGSSLSNYKVWQVGNGRHLGTLGAGISLGITAIILKITMPNMLFMDLWKKIILSIILLLINGLFMGMTFPYSITKIKEQKKEQIISLFYGINGAFSVIGSVMAMIISMQSGITTAIIVGSVLYGVIFALMPYSIGMKESQR